MLPTREKTTRLGGRSGVLASDFWAIVWRRGWRRKVQGAVGLLLVPPGAWWIDPTTVGECA